MNKHILQKFNQETIIVHTLFSILGVLLAVYLGILLSLVFTAIDKKQSILAVKELSTTLSTKEYNYSEAVLAISESSLKDFGFQKITSSTFAVRKDPIATFTLLYER